MRKVWQQACGKEFGRMAQGNNKTGQKGGNFIFVINHTKIAQIRAKEKKLTYARVVVCFCTQKAAIKSELQQDETSSSMQGNSQ